MYLRIVNTLAVSRIRRISFQVRFANKNGHFINGLRVMGCSVDEVVLCWMQLATQIGLWPQLPMSACIVMRLQCVLYVC